jgi:hypothetical protein
LSAVALAVGWAIVASPASAFGALPLIVLALPWSLAGVLLLDWLGLLVRMPALGLLAAAVGAVANLLLIGLLETSVRRSRGRGRPAMRL